MKRQLIFLLTAFLLEASASSLSWNSLLNAGTIFQDEYDSIQVKSIEESSSDILSQLRKLLEDSQTFNTIYTNYKAQFPYPNARPGSQLRMEAFANKLVAIAEHNIQFQLGQQTWEKGVNYYSDFTSEEISAQFGRGILLPSESTVSNLTAPSVSDPWRNVGAAPSTLDWRTSGIVTSVKHQGQCGSCWAFSILGMLEAVVAKKTNKKLDLSEQELVDCTGGRDGCQGNSLDAGLNYIKSNGIGLEKDYPYKGKYGTCSRGSKARAAKVTAWSQTRGLQQTMDVVSQFGPAGIVVWISKEWYDYRGGIYGGGCGTEGNLGPHAVDVVGWNSENGRDYWILKNSWGEGWGEKGYMKYPKGSNKCQVENWIYYVSDAS